MLRAIAIFGFVFLYVPLALLILYSFNDNDRASVWTGFSTKWYGRLWENDALMSAAKNSLMVAVSAASIATILGVLAAYVLVRFSKMRGRTLLDGMVTSPLVMPEVITGFSLLVLFISIENMAKNFGLHLGGRGLLTVIIAHATFGMAYVAVTIRARLLDMDMSIEEAAQDLGAKPMAVFFQITLPIILPSIVAGWLLAFTLSLDDVVIAQFTGGVGSTTLPVMVFSQVRMGVTPEYNALASVIIVSVAILVTMGLQIQRKFSRS